jgi:hypothetical protein
VSSSLVSRSSLLREADSNSLRPSPLAFGPRSPIHLRDLDHMCLSSLEALYNADTCALEEGRCQLARGRTPLWNSTRHSA